MIMQLYSGMKKIYKDRCRMIFKKTEVSIYTYKEIARFVKKKGIIKYICTSLFIHEEIKKHRKDKQETNDINYLHWDR